jgi:hypothetical protein
VDPEEDKEFPIRIEMNDCSIEWPRQKIVASLMKDCSFFLSPTFAFFISPSFWYAFG